MSSSPFQERNLHVQGYELSAAERRRLAAGLRFATGTCLLLVAAATALRSAPGVVALAAVGASAGWSSRHPFDRVWNRFARPAVPPTPRRRRHAFKVAAVWLAVASALLAAGATGPALGLLAVLLALCAVQTATYLCVPSLVIAALEAAAGRGTPGRWWRRGTC